MFLSHSHIHTTGMYFLHRYWPITVGHSAKCQSQATAREANYSHSSFRASAKLHGQDILPLPKPQGIRVTGLSTLPASRISKCACARQVAQLLVPQLAGHRIPPDSAAGLRPPCCVCRPRHCQECISKSPVGVGPKSGPFLCIIPRHRAIVSLRLLLPHSKLQQKSLMHALKYLPAFHPV